MLLKAERRSVGRRSGERVHTEFLFIVAEVAVAFAGFAGLVVAISGMRDQEPEKARLQFELLRNVLGTSLLAITFALIPPMIADMGASPEATWRGSALLASGGQQWWADRRTIFPQDFVEEIDGL